MSCDTTLRNQTDFNRIYQKGRSKVSRFVVIIYRNNGRPYSRTAFVASKKVGNSVERNRSRRVMREAVRLLGRELAPGYDVIFVARNQLLGHKTEEVRRSLYGTLKGIGLL